MAFFDMVESEIGAHHMLLTTLMTLSFLGGSLVLLLGSADLVSFAEQINTRSDVTQDQPCHFPNIVHFAVDDSYDNRGDPASYNTIRTILFAPTCISIVIGVVCAYGLRVTRGADQFRIASIMFRWALLGSALLFVFGNVMNFLYVMETECGPINYATHPETRNYTEHRYNLDTPFGEPRHGSSDIISNRLNEELGSIYDLATIGFSMIIGGVLVATTLGVFHREREGDTLKSTPLVWAHGVGTRFYTHSASVGSPHVGFIWKVDG